MAGIDPARFKRSAANSISYADTRYWNARYTEKGSDPKADMSFAAFEWYLQYAQLKEALAPILVEATPPMPPPVPKEEGAEEEKPPTPPPVAKAKADPKAKAAPGKAPSPEPVDEGPPKPKPNILVLGCGTSSMTEELYAEGYTLVTNVDRCEGLIEFLATKHEAKETLQYKACEVKDLPVEWNDKFDIVIDKACFDIVACSSDAKESVPASLAAVSRVLKPLSGIYVSVSHAAPEIRQPMLSGTNDLKVVVSKKNRWRVSVVPLPRLLAPPADAGAKGAPAKGGAVELKPSNSFRASENTFNMFVCRRPPLLASGDAASWFEFWASPDTVLTCDTLARSLIKSLYVPEPDRGALRAAVTQLWASSCGGAESIQCDKFLTIVDVLREKFCPQKDEEKGEYAPLP